MVSYLYNDYLKGGVLMSQEVLLIMLIIISVLCLFPAVSIAKTVYEHKKRLKEYIKEKEEKALEENKRHETSYWS